MLDAKLSETPPFELQSADPRVAPWLADYPPSLFCDRLYQSIEVLDNYSIDLAISIVGQLKLLDELREWRPPHELAQRCGLQSEFAPAIEWLLRRLVAAGGIEQESDAARFRFKKPLGPAKLAQLRKMAIAIDSTNATTLDLLDHAASIYPAVARGEQNAEEALFGPNGIGLWLAYFSNQNLTYAVNNWVGAIAAARCLEDRSELRILEVGAGGGSATEILLQWLTERGLASRIQRYVVTEPNAFFRRRAQRELTKHYPNLPLAWSALDINQPWASQGISDGEFDLVYGVNVLHVAKDLLFSLAQARSCLSDNGCLVIGECIRPFPDQVIYPELIFQLLSSYRDVILDPVFRPNAGFLTPGEWRSGFERAGFEQIELEPDIEHIRDFYSHFVTGAIRARRPA